MLKNILRHGVKNVISLILLLSSLYSFAQEDTPITGVNQDLYQAIRRQILYVGSDRNITYVDINGDSLIQQSEADQVTELKFTARSLNITSLSGIDKFKNITTIKIYDQPLSYADFSNLKKLTSLSVSGSGLTAIDLSGLRNLTNLELYRNKSLSAIMGLPKLRKLSSFGLGDNPALKEINLKGLKRLEIFYMGINKASPVRPKVRNFQSRRLQKLKCDYSLLVQLKPKVKKSLTWLMLIENSENVTISGFYGLEHLETRSSAIPELTIAHCPNLKKVEVYDIGLTVLNISDCGKMNRLECQKNKLLFLPKVKTLTVLHCGYNELDRIDLKDYPALEALDCQHNNIDKLDLNQCLNIKVINCNRTKIDELDLNNLKKLMWLDCSVTALTAINIENLEDFYYLDAGSCYKLQSIVMKNILLEEFRLGDNHSLKHICVDPVFLNNTKALLALFFKYSKHEVTLDSACPEIGNNGDYVSYDMSTPIKTLTEIARVLQNGTPSELKPFCTYKGYKELKLLYDGKGSNLLYSKKISDFLSLHIPLSDYKPEYFRISEYGADNKLETGSCWYFRTEIGSSTESGLYTVRVN